jgi:hypothetical protein
LRGKGDADGNCAVEIFDVVRAANVILGTPVTPPCEEYQAWAADTDCEAGHPCGDGVVEIFDLVRVVRYIMDGVWPCDGGSSARAAISAPVDVSLAVTEDDGEVAVAVKADNAAGVAGLDMTVSWKRGNLRFVGAEAGDLLGDGWLVEARERHKSVRIVVLDGTGKGLAADGELVQLRFSTRGKARTDKSGFEVSGVSLADAAGNEIN